MNSMPELAGRQHAHVLKCSAQVQGHPAACQHPVLSGLCTQRHQLLSCREHVNRVLSNTGQIKSELARCLLAEFLGTLLFQIFGGAAPPKDTTAPAANGFALVCISEYAHNIPGSLLQAACIVQAGCVQCAHLCWSCHEHAKASPQKCACKPLPLPAVYTFANISGAHLNPAVSFALMCTGHMKWWKGLLYMVMQVGGCNLL